MGDNPYWRQLQDQERTQTMRDQVSATKAQSDAASTNTWLIIGAILAAAVILAWAIRKKDRNPG